MPLFNKQKLLDLVETVVDSQATLATATQTNTDAQVAASTAAAALTTADAANKDAVAALKAEIEGIDANGDEPDAPVIDTPAVPLPGPTPILTPPEAVADPLAVTAGGTAPAVPAVV